jgi:hypothetical protein
MLSRPVSVPDTAPATPLNTKITKALSLDVAPVSSAQMPTAV